MITVSLRREGSCIPVVVQPRAGKDQIVGEMDGALKVRLTAPPVEGAANKHLIRFLAKALGYPKSRLHLASGETSRHKLVCVRDAGPEELSALLVALLSAHA